MMLIGNSKSRKRKEFFLQIEKVVLILFGVNTFRINCNDCIQFVHSGKVIKGFSSSNKGINVSGKRGDSIKAAADGKIVYAGNALRGYGNLIIINHNDEFLSAYAHNDSIKVSEGSMVKKGQVIATMGDSDSKLVCLHFEIRYRGESVDPTQYLP